MKAFYHLPGLFEFYEFYKVFLALYRRHREYFYDWCGIGSIYGAPADCIWGGGRVGFGDADPEDVAELMGEYGISARLTFSNSLLREEHLSDKKCNALCRLFEHNCSVKIRTAENRTEEIGIGENRTGENGTVENGIIVHSDLLAKYIRDTYPEFYLVSSTTKVLRNFSELKQELDKPEFAYVVPDFRLNTALDQLRELSQKRKDKVEFLCNECCFYDCYDRKACYENVSRKSLGEDCEDHKCVSPTAKEGYRFSEAMKNSGFIGLEAIREIYMPAGFSQFKIEGRSLGSAIILEFILYYMTKPEYQLKVREEIYLDSMLDLF